MKKLLSLEDLYNFYLNQNKNCSFNSKEANSSICVHINEDLFFSKEYDPNEYKLKTHLKACHLFENRNHSSISEEAMKKAIPSFYNAPILGYIHQLNDGTYDFGSHEMYMSDDGELIYKEIPVGVIPESCNAALKYDEEKDKTYLEVDGIIFKEYTKAAEILERKKTSKVSVELSVDELSYSADTKVLNIDEFHFLGITILGVTDDDDETPIQEGMYGSNITISDFSFDNNSTCSKYEKNDKLIETLERLNETLKGFDINSTRKEDDDSMSENEELETVEETSEVVEEEVVAEEVTELEEETNDETETEVNYSVSVGEVTKNFSLSLNSKLYALQQLINDTYADDGDYYSVEVFEDENVVEMHGWMKSYRQSFKCKKKCEYSLTGDRVEIFSKWMTQDEISAFERMKANYELNEQKLAEVSEKLAKYEAEPSKMEILNSNDYAQVAECEDYKTLVNEHFDLSIDEVRTKADSILLNYAKTHTVAVENNNTVITRKDFSATNKKTGRYGNIFAK